MKYMEFFEGLYPGFTTSSTDDSNDYRLDGVDYTLEEISELFDIYKNEFNKDYDIKSLKKIIERDIDKDLFKKMNIDAFLKSLFVNLKVSEDDALGYFDNYIDSIPRRYRKIFDKDYTNYENPAFKEVKKIKSKFRNKESEISLDTESPALYTELTKMILWVKENKKKILVTFDGRDTGGKGSISRFILKNFFAAPLGRNILYKDFGIPTKWQQSNWFHRYEKHFPKDGQMVLLDRSWYNRAVNDPVMGYCTDRQYKKFMKDVIPFEEKIADNDIIHIKFWLSINKETQLNRFDQRKASPIKHWKFSPNDLRAVEKWDDFTPYIDTMFAKTATPTMPWVVVNMDDKPLGWLNSLRYILNKVPYEDKNESVLEVYPEIVYEIK